MPGSFFIKTAACSKISFSNRSLYTSFEQFQYSGMTCKETIKNVVHRFNHEELAAETLRKAKTTTVLFIEADEDYVSY